MSTMRRKKFAAGGALEVIEYPINPRLPRYNRVPIANVGEHHPCGWYQDGGVWHPDLAYFQDLQKNYDAIQFVAVVDEGHPNPWAWFDDPGERPVLGLINELYAEGSGDDARLLADLVNLDPLLADEIDAGRWPNRSIEWVDAYDDYAWLKSRRPPDELPELESLFFYGRYARYLTGLAVLGRSWPAVFGLGPWPSRESQAPAEGLVKLPAARRELIPRAASQDNTYRPRVFSLIPTDSKEGEPMAGATGKAKGKESPPVEGGDQDTAAATVETATDPAVIDPEPGAEPKTASQAATGDAVSRAEFEALNARNTRLEAQLLASNREKAIESRLSSFVRAGKLTAQPQREAYRRLASQLFGQPPARLVKSSGEAIQLETAPLADLDALINEMPASATFSLVAGEEPGLSDYGKNAPAEERSKAVQAAAKRLGVDIEGGEQ